MQDNYMPNDQSTISSAWVAAALRALAELARAVGRGADATGSALGVELAPFEGRSRWPPTRASCLSMCLSEQFRGAQLTLRFAEEVLHGRLPLAHSRCARERIPPCVRHCTDVQFEPRLPSWGARVVPEGLY